MHALFFFFIAKIFVCDDEEFVIFLGAVSGVHQQWISVRLAPDLTSVLARTKQITQESVSLGRTAQRGRFI